MRFDARCFSPPGGKLDQRAEFSREREPPCSARKGSRDSIRAPALEPAAEPPERWPAPQLDEDVCEASRLAELCLGGTLTEKEQSSLT